MGKRIATPTFETTEAEHVAKFSNLTPTGKRRAAQPVTIAPLRAASHVSGYRSGSAMTDALLGTNWDSHYTPGISL